MNIHRSNQAQQDFAALNTTAGLKRDAVAISELSQVTFISKDAFLSGLAQLQSALELAAPIHLPNTQKYYLELRANELHVHSAAGIERYEITDPSRKVQSISQDDNTITIVLESNGRSITLVLHRDEYTEPGQAKKARRAPQARTQPSYESPLDSSYAAPRITSPWRAYEPTSSSSARSSESCGGVRGGER